MITDKIMLFCLGRYQDSDPQYLKGFLTSLASGKLFAFGWKHNFLEPTDNCAVLFTVYLTLGIRTFALKSLVSRNFCEILQNYAWVKLSPKEQVNCNLAA